MSRNALLTACWTLIALASACGGDGGPSGDTAADVEVTPEVSDFPDFSVGIDASRLSGNAPLTIDFSAVVTGVAKDALTYRWLVDGSPLGSDPTFTHAFFRAGSSTVVLEATFTREDGEVKVADATSIVSVRACADLRFDRFSVDAPTELPPGGTLRVKVGKVFNDGDAIEDAFQLALGLSSDDHFDAATDVLVLGPTYQSMTSGLAQDSSIDVAGVTFTLPEDLPEGSYFAFLVADPGQTVNECQEANNVEASTNSVDIDKDAGKLPDLVLQQIDVAADLTVAQGDILNYSFKIKNQGEADAKQFRHAFWLSRDAVLSPETDLPIALASDEGARVQSMAAGLALGFFKSYRIPDDLPDGDWWVVGKVDATDLVGESDESNNVVASAHPFTMRYQAPDCADLALVHLLVSPLSTYWGGSVRLEVTVANPGTRDVPEGWLFRAYLSLQRALDPASATVVGTYPLAAVPAGEERSFEILIPVTDDLPVVPHYVAGLLDPTNALDECSETNNVAVFGEPVKIAAVASVDVAAERFDYHPDQVQAGDTIKVEYDLANHGTSAATTFQVGVVLSPDGTFSRDGIASGQDIVIDKLTVGTLQPDELVTKIRDVVVPTGLDHAVASYHVAVLADLDGFLTSDTDFSNNLKTSDKLLGVSGADGGCFEDAHEPDDTRIEASTALPGTETDLGSCGDADWFDASIPAGHSLLVDVDARPIVAFPPVSSNLVVELTDPGGAVIQTATFGPHYEVRAFAVPVGGTYSVRVAGASAADRAAYDLTVVDQPPRTGIDVVVYDARPAPAVSYPGGRLAVAWREVNLGTVVAPARVTRIWLSKDRALDGNDLALGEVAGAPLPPQQNAAHDTTVAVPSNVPGGSWYVLVQADADGDVGEVDEQNNLVAGGPIALDPLKVCNDDGREPNDEPGIATLLGPSERVSDAVVCPGLPDWYAVDLVVGQSLEAELSYDYDPSKGKLVLELWDPTGQAALVTESRTSTMRVTLPSAWQDGRWLVRVANEAGALSAPYRYDLAVTTVAPGPVAAR
ncbi:MAG: CARDB domain-containing protein [Myxococcota bacterium]